MEAKYLHNLLKATSQIAITFTMQSISEISPESLEFHVGGLANSDCEGGKNRSLNTMEDQYNF
jgi:hypothetical protein